MGKLNMKIEDSSVSEGGSWGPHWEIRGKTRQVHCPVRGHGSLIIRGHNEGDFLTIEIENYVENEEKELADGYKTRMVNKRFGFTINLSERTTALMLRDILKFLEFRRKRLKDFRTAR